MSWPRLRLDCQSEKIKNNSRIFKKNFLVHYSRFPSLAQMLRPKTLSILENYKETFQKWSFLFLFHLITEHKQKRPIWNVSLLFPIETCSQKRVYVYVPLLTRGTFLINKKFRKLISVSFHVPGIYKTHKNQKIFRPKNGWINDPKRRQFQQIILWLFSFRNFQVHKSVNKNANFQIKLEKINNIIIYFVVDFK
jgi:hypothetical protein